MKSHLVDSIFKAFSDMNRLRILNLLKQGEQCVCELMRVLNMRQPKVSRHLAYLRRAGLVDARKDGLWVHYSLSRPQAKVQERLLKCIDYCLDDVPTLKKDLKILGEKRVASEKGRP
ncbi:MAG: metalloregulator ArsR/SmtB family transcription factor [Elusimicrobia bacterium]|nr:metalloregulator ArsR/SmtB family transcription factor [Candidatus Obscuribacterium magneticum]